MPTRRSHKQQIRRKHLYARTRCVTPTAQFERCRLNGMNWPNTWLLQHSIKKLSPGNLGPLVACTEILIRINSSITISEAWTLRSRSTVFRSVLYLLTYRKSARSFSKSIAMLLIQGAVTQTRYTTEQTAWQESTQNRLNTCNFLAANHKGLSYSWKIL